MTLETLRKKYESFNIIMLSLEDTNEPIFKLLHAGKAAGYINGLRDTETIKYAEWMEMNNEISNIIINTIQKHF